MGSEKYFSLTNDKIILLIFIFIILPFLLQWWKKKYKKNTKLESDNLSRINIILIFLIAIILGIIISNYLGKIEIVNIK